MLKDTAARNARPGTKAYKLSDQQGLYLFVAPKSTKNPSGAKSWRFDYRFAGRRETLTIGRYPEVTLADARAKLAEARKLLARDESPAMAKQQHIVQAKFAHQNTIKAVCERYYDSREGGLSDSWRANARRWLDEDIYPAIGAKPAQQVTEDDVRALVLKVAKDRGPTSGELVRQLLAAVYGSLPRALGAGNPARDAGGAKRAGSRTRGHKPILVEIPRGKPKGMPLPARQVPELLKAIEAADAKAPVKLAARLLLLTFTRKQELMGARWDEIDVERGEWTVPPARMKMDRSHIVPLSRQAVECFKLLQSPAAGSAYVFPKDPGADAAMGRNVLNTFFHEIGFPQFTPHSARSTASTILNSQGFSADAIELQLAHAEKNKTRAAYNHSDRMDERRRMMQAWADYLDNLCADGKVTPIRQAIAA